MPNIEITRQAQDPHETQYGIRDDTSSRGVDLDGATIIANYADGTSETLTWRALDPYTFGGASGENIEMRFGYDWHELTTTKPLASLEFDLQPASSVFDTTRTADDDPAGGSTPTSLEGFPFELAPEHDGISGTIGVVYSGIVNLAGSEPAGDLFTTMKLDFSGLPDGGMMGDLRWNSDIDTMREKGDLKPASVACFLRGTRITTAEGDLPVEMLRPGMQLLTQGKGLQELLLVLNRKVGAEELARNPRLRPVRIAAGALGAGLPRRDLRVSRQHRMLVRSGIAKRMFGGMGVLVSAARLTELPGIGLDEAAREVEYYHLVLARHEVIFAEGAPSESFLLTAETHAGLTAAQRATLARCGALGGPFAEVPALPIPPQAQQREMVVRHARNARQLLAL